MTTTTEAIEARLADLTYGRCLDLIELCQMLYSGGRERAEVAKKILELICPEVLKATDHAKATVDDATNRQEVPTWASRPEHLRD